MSNQEALIGEVILGGVFLLLNPIFLFIIFNTRRKMATVQSWPSVLGVVTNSYLERRDSGDGSTNYAVVKYSYQVAGQRYQSSRLAPGPEVGGTGTRKVVERYPAGAQVMVFYNPEKPSDAVLERKAPAQWLFWMMLAIFDVMLCVMMVIFGVTLLN